MNNDIDGAEDRLKLYRQNKAFQEEEPNKIAEYFMSLLVAGKHREAQQMLSRGMKSRAESMGGVSNESLKEYYRFGALKSYTLTLNRNSDDSVRYAVVVVGNGGVTHNDVLNLVRDGGFWKISGF